MQLQHIIIKILVAISVVILVSACKNSDRNIPFPAEESEFAQANSKPFKFSEPEQIKWIITDPDSLKAWSEKKFDLAKIPSKPFDIGEPVPLPMPMEEKKLDRNSLPDTVFDLNKLSTQKLKFKTILMQPPKITKAGWPSVKAGTTRGIMDAGSIGLPGNGRCFLQDQSGLLWIGTEKGLCRYDGINLEIYGTDQGLLDPNISAICKDQGNRIWVGTMSGEIYVLDRKSGLAQQLVDTLKRGSIFGMIQDNDGQMWIARSGAGIVIINTEKQTVKKFSSRQGLSDNFNIKLMQDRQGLIWITTFKGVNILDLKEKKNKRLAKKNGLNDDRLVTVYQDQTDAVWLGGFGGAEIVNIKDGTIKYLWKDQGITDVGFVSGFLQDKTGKMWMGTREGTVFSFDQKLNLLEKFKVTPADGNIIYNLLEDKEGQIWLGTIKGGTFSINPKQGRPGNLTTADGLGNNAVWATLEAQDGNIWIGTVDGINVYNPATKTIKHIGKEQGIHHERMTHLTEDSQGRIWACGNNFGISIIDVKKGTIKYLGKAQGLRNNTVTTVMEDAGGQFWLASNTGEVYIINPEQKILKQIGNLPEWKDNFVNTLKVDKKGQLWISSHGAGVLVIDPLLNTMKRLTATLGLVGNEATTLLEDHAGNMWIGNEKGIDVINNANTTITTFTTLEGLANNAIYTLDELNGKIYAGTSSGLTMLTPLMAGNTKQPKWNLVTYGKPQGFSYLDFAENSSLVTRKGQYWAGIEEQILTVMDEPEPDSVLSPTYVTGISILDKPQVFSDITELDKHAKEIDTLWKAEKGMFYKNKQLPADSGYLQKNKIRWDGIETAYHLPVNLRLPDNQNYLSFTFSGVHLSNPDKVKYRYILEGIDKNWSPVSENNFSENYRDLPPGHYTFKAASKGMNGLWSVPAEFNFTILPPWWQSWWAYGIYGLLLLAAIWAVHLSQKVRTIRKERERTQKKELEQAKEIEKAYTELKSTQTQLIQSEKMASLGELTAGIAHEIQNPLNFINNFSDVNSELIEEMKTELQAGNKEDAIALANDIAENEKKINHHGKRADAIVKGMLQHSRSSNGIKVPTDINTLADEYLRLSYHGLRAKDKEFNATLKTDFDVTIGKINVVPQDIGRVILNLITNAFYAVSEKKNQRPEGYEPIVVISTKRLNGKVEIRVSDNGNGIPQKVLDKIFQPFFTTKPAGQGTGLGLSMSYDIIKVHGGELKVETKENEGSAFIILIPLNSN